ncbi:MAG: ATP-binding protein [Treponema sp.]|nr:ATP-binding protein [Treponema sp.]
MENKTIEWKETWHDEYMKTICAFANTSGGELEIGRNDKGEIIGLTNVSKLLEDIPNKIKSAMAIIADIEMRESDEKQYIVISYETCRPVAVSSGSGKLGTRSLCKNRIF